MCQVWDTTKDLPETQAALYKRFTLYHYEWKQTEFPTTLAQQNELNSALGKLAQKAIASGKTRFRIGQNFAYRVMGENLFDRACRLGWLNQVDRDKQTEEPFYAFYHATFQEYFAALAIDDWHFLLNHVLNNPSQGIYRIFEPQWKQVILLWLGCEKVEPEQKEQFIKALIEFNDECGEFYQYRAYFLAAAGIAEFRDCSKADEIVEQIAKWSFGYFNENYQWLTFIEPIADQAKEALQQTEREKAIQKLVQLINSVVGQREYTHYLVAESLVKIGVGSPIAIKLLKQIIGSAKDEYILRLTANCLGKIDPGNQIAIEKLEQLINLTEEQFTLGNLTEEQFTLGNLTEEQFTLGLLVHNLLEIESGNPIAIQKLLQIIESAKDESTLWQAAENLGRIEIGNPVAIHALKRIIKSATNTYTLYLAADSLGKISPGNSTAIQTLVPLMKSAKTDRYDLRGNIAWSLVKIGTDNIIVAIEELLKLIESTDDALTRYLAVDSLKKLEPHHSRAIQELEKLIQFSNDEYTCCLAASSLVKDNPEHTEALSKLKQFLQSNDESIRYIAIECLLQIDSLNQKVVKQLEHILMATSNMSIRSQSIETLKKCIQNEHLTVIIENWKEYLSHETYKKNLSLFHLSYKLIWHCAQNMPYLSFYQAWHH
ncbi:hypothetical protein DP117_10695 [Brasilonema sp. UFV-L1]|nr:hypothetical protein [Brasilonema sp. UFV-L1]